MFNFERKNHPANRSAAKSQHTKDTVLKYEEVISLFIGGNKIGASGFKAVGKFLSNNTHIERLDLCIQSGIINY